MNIDIGVMQGRLVPPVDGKIQAFPLEMWREEFRIARLCGLKYIEWIYEHNNCHVNPVSSGEGIQDILRIANLNQVRVTSICADYFMRCLLVETNGEKNQDSLDHLRWLIQQARHLEATTIVLPFVDSSSLVTKEQIITLLNILNGFRSELEALKVQLHLEMDLNPELLREFKSGLVNQQVKFVYDIGNSAALGFSPTEELGIIGDLLGTVHIKDRLRNGGTVELGHGDADFNSVFSILGRSGFRGPYTLQTARVAQKPEEELARHNMEFVSNLFNHYLCP